MAGVPPAGLPAESTFSFKSPYPVSVAALKQRRVSLASAPSPRIVPQWSFRDEMGLDSSQPADESLQGQVRKLDSVVNVGPAEENNGDANDAAVASTSMQEKEKRPRKKWSTEETDMLVYGIKLHGVGNWKNILQDPNLTFHDRSPVDLKDRFRTYYNDAYKHHYPNARTHLSNKVRSINSDGTALFEKTRSKKRRPFTEEEDQALKAGYDKHGTVWALIVKDPIFQESGRRSTDLRDRFRNAYPLLYQAAGYKPRTSAKKRLASSTRDDAAKPVRSRRKQGLLRGGTKSVPQSTACSEDEYSSGGEEPAPPRAAVFVHTAPNFKRLKITPSAPPAAEKAPSPMDDNDNDNDDNMELIDSGADDPLNIPDFQPNHAHADMETWSSGLSTPTHSSSAAAWSTSAPSPASSSQRSLLVNHSNSPSGGSSPLFDQRQGNEHVAGFGMIGKSAWGQGWFSTNPRLDASEGSGSSSYIHSTSPTFSPVASPFSFNNHGVLDRYDLFPPHMPEDGRTSEAEALMGHGDLDGNASIGGTGFKGYHSQIAGDLISAGMHQQTYYPFLSSTSFAALSSSLNGASNNATSSANSASASSMFSVHGMYNMLNGGQMGLGGGCLGVGVGGLGSTMGGIGQQQQQQQENQGIHPMQLHTPHHQHGFSHSQQSIDELGLTGISLNDESNSSASNNNANGAQAAGSTTGGSGVANGNVVVVVATAAAGAGNAPGQGNGADGTRLLSFDMDIQHSPDMRKDGLATLESLDLDLGPHSFHHHTLHPQHPHPQIQNSLRHSHQQQQQRQRSASTPTPEGSLDLGLGVVDMLDPIPISIADSFGLEDLLNLSEAAAEEPENDDDAAGPADRGKPNDTAEGANGGQDVDAQELELEQEQDVDTPPATPVVDQPRPMRPLYRARRSSGSWGAGFGSSPFAAATAGAGGALMHGMENDFEFDGGHHARSISVPPSEARNAYYGMGGVGVGGGGGGGGASGDAMMSIDDVGIGLGHHGHSSSFSAYSHYNNGSFMNALSQNYAHPLPSHTPSGSHAHGLDHERSLSLQRLFFNLSPTPTPEPDPAKTTTTTTRTSRSPSVPTSMAFSNQHTIRGSRQQKQQQQQQQQQHKPKEAISMRLSSSTGSMPAHSSGGGGGGGPSSVHLQPPQTTVFPGHLMLSPTSPSSASSPSSGTNGGGAPNSSSPSALVGSPTSNINLHNHNNNFMSNLNIFGNIDTRDSTAIPFLDLQYHNYNNNNSHLHHPHSHHHQSHNSVFNAMNVDHHDTPFDAEERERYEQDHSEAALDLARSLSSSASTLPLSSSSSGFGFGGGGGGFAMDGGFQIPSSPSLATRRRVPSAMKHGPGLTSSGFLSPRPPGIANLNSTAGDRPGTPTQLSTQQRSHAGNFGRAKSKSMTLSSGSSCGVDGNVGGGASGSGSGITSGGNPTPNSNSNANTNNVNANNASAPNKRQNSGSGILNRFGIGIGGMRQGRAGFAFGSSSGGSSSGSGGGGSVSASASVSPNSTSNSASNNITNPRSVSLSASSSTTPSARRRSVAGVGPGSSSGGTDTGKGGGATVGIGRSMSHHRGQSAVLASTSSSSSASFSSFSSRSRGGGGGGCGGVRDLGGAALKSGDKRKRASWDGGAA